MSSKITRRDTLRLSGATAALATGATALRARHARAQAMDHGAHGGMHHGGAVPAPAAGETRTSAVAPQRGRVIVPNGEVLAHRMVDGVKVFHLVAEEVEHEFAPGLVTKAWGYNGRTPGPTIEAVEGDRVRIYVTNRLPAPTSVHWHGMLVPSGMDGVGGLSQRAIKPGETFRYEFTLRQHGTLMYHAHHDEMVQIGLGLTGLFIVHPREERRPVDRDFALLLHEWFVPAGTARPDPNEMIEFNVLTLNGKVFPATEPLVVGHNERVRLRLGNLSPTSHHPIHVHGHSFRVVETDGGEVPQAGQWPEVTVIVPVGATRTIEFVADNPGDWAIHCHMTHHVMNQMGHGLPNMVGVDPTRLDRAVASLLPAYMTMGQDGMGEHGVHIQSGHMAVPRNSIPMVGAAGPHGYIAMGGMMTVMKVREHLTGDGDPDWYEAPRGTQADVASAAELRRDGITV
jgi:FtsP/CotA-like multicopper oxidase with cupredoxin domain